MKAPRSNAKARYRRALTAFVNRRDDERALAEGYELGRSALAQGQSLIDLLAMHRSLVPQLLAGATSKDLVAERYDRAEEFLAQTVMPFEMTHQGWHQTVERLRHLYQSLEQQVAARTIELHDSEQRFKDIAEVAADWIWESGPDHRFTSFVGNRLTAMEAAEIRPPDTHGKTRWEIAGVDPETDEHWRAHKADLESHRQFRQFRYALQDPSGTRRYLSASGQPVFDTTGVFLGYRGTVTDETDLIEALERARRAETLLKDAIESISEGFLICDAEDRIVLFNQAMRDLSPGCDDVLKPGTPFAEFARRLVAAGQIPSALGREEAWIAERTKRHRNPGLPWESHRSGDRSLLVSERRMSDGGIAGLRIDITALKRAEAALRDSEERLDRAQEIAGLGSWERDVRTGRYVWSKEMYRICGLERGTSLPSIESVVDFIHTDDIEKVREWLGRVNRGTDAGAIEFRMRRPDGQLRIVGVEGRPVRNDKGEIVKVAGTLQDITERRSMEQQFIKAQKMEAIGSLTGGLAHDFNNLLGIVMGNLDLLSDEIHANPRAEEMLTDALDATKRGAELTRRLLAFARRQPLQPERVDLNESVGEMFRLLSRTLGEQIEIVLKLDPDVRAIVVDPAQLEAAIANLATNARDAMPNGGRLLITTGNRGLDAEYASRQVDVVPGDYALLEVTDSGIGMSPEVMNRIFEPFFTTKESGKGTGLGLAMVFGFMKQSGGHVSVYSEPDHGTTFRLYLPYASSGEPSERDQSPESRDPIHGHETILVVEDNVAMRKVAVRQLTALGYAVIEAENGQQAISLLEGDRPIDLVFSDIVMPGRIDGHDLALKALALRPKIKILWTSGFPETRISRDLDELGAVRLLSKPYRTADLALAVRQALDQPNSGGSS